MYILYAIPLVLEVIAGRSKVVADLIRSPQIGAFGPGEYGREQSSSIRDLWALKAWKEIQLYSIE
jgi:hypothetical protein